MSNYYETLAVKELKPYEKNARVHSKKQIERIANSIKEFGFTSPVLINENNMILAGHGRVEAAKLLALETIPCVRVKGLTEKQTQAYILADNRIAELSKWDDDLLSNKLKELLSVNFDLSLIGFDTFKFEELKDGLTDEDGIPTDIENRAKLGDLWECGDHRLFCGDSTNPQHYETLVADFNPIAMITDPPYGVDYKPEWRNELLPKAKRNIGNVLNDKRIDWSEAYSLFTGDAVYIWHSSKFTHVVAQHIENCGYDLISQIIWVKQHFALSQADYHYQHEPCWYAIKKGQKHNWQGARDQATVWEIKNNNSFGNRGGQEEKTWGHGTQKPLECMLKPIINNTKKGDYIYDPFGGSGTTLIAAEKSGRYCLMMELDPKYVNIILARYEEFSGKKAVRIIEADRS